MIPDSFVVLLYTFFWLCTGDISTVTPLETASIMRGMSPFSCLRNLLYFSTRCFLLVLSCRNSMMESISSVAATW